MSKLQRFLIGDKLPHGSFQEITEIIEQKMMNGELPEKSNVYQLVRLTLKGSVSKMKPIHDAIVEEAKAILERENIEIPK